MKTKVKPNRYKPGVAGKGDSMPEIGSSIDFCLKWLMIVAGISVLSLALIFGHDLVTQSTLFHVRQVDISGNARVTNDAVIRFAGLDKVHNIFKLNIHSLEKKIISHPWIASASVKRNLAAGLTIEVVEHEALAIVRIENIADILINTQGRPFKEYNPSADHLETLPVITGLDLTQADSRYIFDGRLFNAVMRFLTIADTHQTYVIHADNHTGITLNAGNVRNLTRKHQESGIPIKIGFDNFQAKLNRAEIIHEYIDSHYPERVVIAMDLFNINKVFVKTKRSNSGLNTIEKGV